MRIARRPTRVGTSVNMTPLLDMMFILVIFFLATSRFQQDERDQSIQLVKSRSKMPISTVSDLVVINIDQHGNKSVEQRPRSLDEIETLLRERLKDRPETEVVVRADRRALVQHLEETLEICHRLGIKTPKVPYEAVEDRR